MGGLKWLVITLGLLAVVAVALAGWGAQRWAAATRALEAGLEAARRPPPSPRYDPAELEGLPAPVQRYFRAALTPGQPVVVAAQVSHEGQFNMGERSDLWKPFRSRQRVVTQRPGFVWDGRIAMAPGLPVHVHDAYVAGVGVLHPALLGLVSLMNLRGTPEVAEGEFMRFLAEAPWYPTALLPSQGVRWQALDERSARATLSDGELTLTLTFGFGADDLVEWVRAEARNRTVEGRAVPTPWEGRWSNVQAQAGMRVPMSGEVAWLLSEGRKVYWRGTITSLRYEFAP